MKLPNFLTRSKPAPRAVLEPGSYKVDSITLEVRPDTSSGWLRMVLSDGRVLWMLAANAFVTPPKS